MVKRIFRRIRRLLGLEQHLLKVYIDKGLIHPSASFGQSLFDVPPQSDISFGANSIFQGKLFFHRPGKFRMGTRSYVGENTSIHISDGVTIGDDVMISWGCTLIDTNMHSLTFDGRKNDVLITGKNAGLTGLEKDWSVVKSGEIIIHDKVWIGFNSIILKQIIIGEGAVIGAGSVVTKNVQPWTMVAGNPACVIKKYLQP